MNLFVILDGRVVDMPEFTKQSVVDAIVFAANPMENSGVLRLLRANGDSVVFNKGVTGIIELRTDKLA